MAVAQDKRASELTAPVSIADTDVFPGYRPGTGGEPNLDIRASAGLLRAPIIDGLASGDVTVAASGVVLSADPATGQGAGRVADALNDMDINVRRHGAVGDGVTDDTAAIQSAIDHADALYVSGFPWFKTIFFPRGKYRITSTIVWKRCHLLGGGPYECYLLWDTASVAGTVLARPATSILRTRMRGLGLQSLNEAPAIWIDQTNNNTSDYGEWMEEMYFGPCTTAAIRLSSAITNVHMRRLRFDAMPFCIEFLDGFGNSAFRSISLSDFTMDANSVSLSHQALFHIQIRGSTSIALNISNGRIEGDDAALASKAAIVYMDEPAGQTMPTNPLMLVLQGVTVQWASLPLASTYNIVYQDTTVSSKTTCVSDIIVLGCIFSGVDAYFGGTWSTFALAPTIAGSGRVGFHFAGGSTNFIVPYAQILGSLQQDGSLLLKESISAPSVNAAYTQIYVPSTGDLTVKDGSNTIRTIQIDAAASTIEASTAVDIATLKTDFNALLTALRTEGIIQ